MKTRSFISSSSIAVLGIQSIFALEAPADLAPPPPAIVSPADPVIAEKPLRFTPLAADPKKLPATPASAFLGVVTSALPEILTEHLKLENGMGIIVRSLLPDGPAALAGLAVHDIITQVAGQPIASPQDLSKLVAAKIPGDRVNIEFIHRGERKTLDVVLGTRPENSTAAAEPPTMDQLNLDALPKELADRVRGAIQGNLGKLDIPSGEEDLSISPAMQDAMKQATQALQHRTQLQSGTTLRMKDTSGSIELKSDHGSKQITLRDPQNQIVFSGPWNNEQDQAAAPPEVRQRIADLQLEDPLHTQASQPKRIPAVDP